MISQFIVLPGVFHGTDRVLDTIEVKGIEGTLGGVPAVRWRLSESPFVGKTQHWRKGRGCGKECGCSGPRVMVGGEPVQMIEESGLVVWTYEPAVREER